MKDYRDPMQKWKPSGRHSYWEGEHPKRYIYIYAYIHINVYLEPSSFWSFWSLYTSIFLTKSLATWDVSFGASHTQASTKRELGRLAALMIRRKDGRLSDFSGYDACLWRNPREKKETVAAGGRIKRKQLCDYVKARYRSPRTRHANLVNCTSLHRFLFSELSHTFL